ncbi:hypothetical protein VP01_248g1 [Puccinia sorghi]|uniref:Uncharacterized protein n=1 Tax=Puccinia sorghi TaxID=27349 RepID=A0A0L6V5Y9_9BASI|nr:hypothetical protein VP01_248g1 [Puccinia sorghi]
METDLVFVLWLHIFRKSVFTCALLSYCSYKQFRNSDPCDTALFIKKRIYWGPKDPVLTWMTWLLSVPERKKEIQDWIQVNEKTKDKDYFTNNRSYKALCVSFFLICSILVETKFLAQLNQLVCLHFCT